MGFFKTKPAAPIENTVIEQEEEQEIVSEIEEQEIIEENDAPVAEPCDLIVHSKKSFLSVRKGPGLEYERINVVTRDDSLHIVECLNGFGHLEQDGWVLLEFVQ